MEELEAGSYFRQPGEPAPATDGAGGVREEFPALLRELADKGISSCLCAVGHMVQYLREVLLDRAVLPLARIALLPQAEEEGMPATATAAASRVGPPLLSEDPLGAVPHARLDGAALENLEVLENSEGGAQGSLLAAVDCTATPGGRRLLRSWLMRPLLRAGDIRARQEAIRDLMSGAGRDAAQRARALMHGLPDLERSLARLHASVAGGGTGRDAAHVVLYEDAARRRVQALIQAIRGLRSICGAVECFREAVGQGAVRSPLLVALVSPGRGAFPDVEALLRESEEAADWEAAAQQGRVVPNSGVDPAFDAAVDAVRAAEQALQDYLKSARRQLGAGSEVSFSNQGGNTHLVEVPESLVGKVPGSWSLAGNRKGFRKYSTPEQQELVRQLGLAEGQKEKAMGGILARIVHGFVQHRARWQAAVDCLSNLGGLPGCQPAATPSTPAADTVPRFTSQMRSSRWPRRPTRRTAPCAAPCCWRSRMGVPRPPSAPGPSATPRASAWAPAAALSRTTSSWGGIARRSSCSLGPTWGARARCCGRCVWRPSLPRSVPWSLRRASSLPLRMRCTSAWAHGTGSWPDSRPSSSSSPRPPLCSTAPPEARLS